MKTETVSTETITRAPAETAPQPLAAVSTQGQPPATPAAVAKPPRADGVTLLAVYHFMLAGLLLLATMGLAIPTVITAIVGVVEDSDALIATGILGLLATVAMVACIVMLAVGFGLWTLRQWARVATIALSVLGLMFVPIGTLIGGVTLWYLLKPEVAAEFR
ncbi:MAG: hypothetical protein H6644_07665 [Caldilineaceae bacterium]|nr:hypothetical protein [Caldilineaceae bacterium]